MTKKQKNISNNDILSLLEEDLGHFVHKSGRYYFWHCPFHQDHTPSLAATPDNNRWYCFSCGEGGGEINWRKTYRKENLQRNSYHRSQHEQIEPTMIPAPDETWQARAAAYCTQWQKKLWSPNNKPALEYLRTKRSLTDETIRIWGLGFNPSPIYEQPDLWGQTRKKRKIYLPRGISIPWIINQQYWKVNFRQNRKPKYLNIPGGRTSVFGLHTLLGKPIAFIVEGEFDCILLAQEIGDLAGVCTLGSASSSLHPQWYSKFLECKRIYILGDEDTAGQRWAAKLKLLSRRIHALRLPAGKDITEFWQQGGNLREWVVSVINKR